MEKSDNEKKTEFIPLICGVLPTNKKLNIGSSKDVNIEELPLNIQKYIDDFKEFCAIEEVRIEYDKTSRTITLHIEVPTEKKDLMIKRCIGFNYVVENSPFYETYIPLKNNSKHQLEGTTIDRYKTYFEHSLLPQAIRNTKETSIAPYPKYNYTMNPYEEYSSVTIKDSQMLEDGKLYVKGEFYDTTKKGCINQAIDLEKNCVVTDAGVFNSFLAVGGQCVTVLTSVHAKRNILGTNLDRHNDLDKLFNFLTGDGSNGDKTIIENFCLIASGRRLLHYSEDYDSFEIYDLPENWKIEDGLDRLQTCPKIFKSGDDSMDDPDLEEVYKILNARRKYTEKRDSLPIA